MIIGVSETYDVVVTIPVTPDHNADASDIGRSLEHPLLADSSYEFQATAEDRTGSASLWLGQGPAHALPRLPVLNYFDGMKMMNGMMRMNGDLNNMNMQMSDQKMDMNSVM